MHLGIAAIERRQASKPGKPHAFALGVNLQRVLTEIPPHDRAQPRKLTGGTFGFGRITQGVAAIILQRESHMWIGHGEALDRVSHGHAFGALALHEFQPGGGGIEKVAHFDPCARLAAPGKGGRAGAFHPARLDKHFRRILARRSG